MRTFAALTGVFVAAPPSGTASRSAASGARPGSSGSKAKDVSAKKAPKKLASAAPKHSSGVLGGHAARILDNAQRAQLALLIVLGAAILLLAVGAIPREVVPHPATAAFLARRRMLIAAGGLVALTTFLVSYFLG